MQIKTVSYLPPQLKTELLSEPADKALTPGLVLSAIELGQTSPALGAALAGIQKQHGLLGSPTLVMPPGESAAVFNAAELDLLRAIAGQIAKAIDPRLKTGLDGIWLVYRAYKLREEWNQPDRNTTACLLKLAGLGMSAAGIAGRIDPDLKIADPWANGINFFIRSGGAIAEGKTPPLNEMMLSTIPALDIPLKALKVAGIALDPENPALPTIPLSQAILRPGPVQPQPATAEAKRDG